MEFYASCPTAFEQALARELRDLGMWRTRPLKGRVSFEGELRDAYRACLWSHLASRVHVVLGRFGCATADDLYEGINNLPWPDLVRSGASISVTAHGTNGALHNTHYSMLRAKDAIVDRIRSATGVRPNVDAHHPDVHLVLSIRGERASISLDLSGDALFKRIPRAVLARAHQDVDILRPDYAALALAEGGWPDLCRAAHERGAEPPVLVDLACADGGIVLEAASWLTDRAPGATRTRWGFQAWAFHDPRVWRELLAEARDREEAAHRRLGRAIITDPVPRAVSAARHVIAAARLSCTVDVIDPTVHALRAALGRKMAPGIIVADTSIMAPSTSAIAMRLLAETSELSACRAMTLSCLSRGHEPARVSGRTQHATSTFTLGTDELQLTIFEPLVERDADASRGAMPPNESSADAQSPDGGASQHRRPESLHATADIGDGKPIPLLIPESEQFARRLIKVARQRRRWAKRAGVTCYRVYDADLPDYAAAIDLYEGSERTPGRWLVIAEYAAPRSIDPALARDRMLDILAIAPRVLDVPPEHVHIKTRQRSRGGSQYGKQARGARGPHATDAVDRETLIEEGGLTFAVNFDDYLDTGIFLDHRTTRSLVRKYARQAETFLNLFAYTGTASCYAADGGASETVTVDLSNTYLDWAAYNMELNGFTGSSHHFVRDDVLSWIGTQIRRGNRWDLIFCDPPTFSNSSRMGERSFDVQRDHVELLRGVSELLEPGGKAIFSCNLRGFKPDYAALAAEDIELTDITEQTIPEDFQRNKRIHHCYLVLKN